MNHDIMSGSPDCRFIQLICHNSTRAKVPRIYTNSEEVENGFLPVAVYALGCDMAQIK